MRKFLPYIFIALILVGLLGPTAGVWAQSPEGDGTCFQPAYDITQPKVPNKMTRAQCGLNTNANPMLAYDWIPTGSTTPLAPLTAYQDCINNIGQPGKAVTADDCKGLSGASAANPQQSPYQKAIGDQTCSIIPGSSGTFWPGCFVQVSYGLFWVIPSFLLYCAAYFFNVLISITLSSQLFAGSSFIATGWAVIRDISNIFFILILLWVAFEMILGLGHDAKKTIVNVIIMALLINFSMFFTEIVIDTSNIVALIFYNKMEVNTEKSIGGTVKQRVYSSATGEKDVAGGMAAAFDPTSKLDANFFTSAGNIPVPGDKPLPGAVSPELLIGITIVAGLIMGFAAWYIFIAGFNFLGRMVELFALIVFSPFAFMSFPVPALRKVEYMGWDEWLNNLMAVAFMAPIFMFFVYLIFLLIQSPLFDSLKALLESGNAGFIRTILVIGIPAIIILRLLHKASKAAEKGGGEVGKFLVSAGKAVVGVATTAALGAATGGAGMALRGTLGRTGAAIGNSGAMKKWEAKGWGGGMVRSAFKGVGGASFDIRGAKIGGKTLASATGINMGEAQKGGFTQARKDAVEKRKKRAKELEVGEDEGLKQELNGMEGGLQKLLNANLDKIRKYDKDIEEARQNLADAGTPEEKATRAAELKSAKDAKLTFRKTTKDDKGRSIYDLEKTLIPEQRDKIAIESKLRKQNYADTVEGTFGRLLRFVNPQHSHKGAREAAYQIRMDAKIDSGEKGQ